MSTKSMDVFSLRDSVVGECRGFAISFTIIHATGIRRARPSGDSPASKMPS